jgi:hypothetical protein
MGALLGGNSSPRVAEPAPLPAVAATPTLTSAQAATNYESEENRKRSALTNGRAATVLMGAASEENTTTGKRLLGQ